MLLDINSVVKAPNSRQRWLCTRNTAIAPVPPQLASACLQHQGGPGLLLGDNTVVLQPFRITPGFTNSTLYGAKGTAAWEGFGWTLGSIPDLLFQMKPAQGHGEATFNEGFSQDVPTLMSSMKWKQSSLAELGSAKYSHNLSCKYNALIHPADGHSSERPQNGDIWTPVAPSSCI